MSVNEDVGLFAGLLRRVSGVTVGLFDDAQRQLAARVDLCNLERYRQTMIQERLRYHLGLAEADHAAARSASLTVTRHVVSLSTDL